MDYKSAFYLTLAVAICLAILTLALDRVVTKTEERVNVKDDLIKQLRRQISELRK